MLINSHHNFASFLESRFVTPVRIHLAEDGCDTVVFSEEEDLYRGHAGNDVDSGISCTNKMKSILFHAGDKKKTKNYRIQTLTFRS